MAFESNVTYAVCKASPSAGFSVAESPDTVHCSQHALLYMSRTPWVTQIRCMVLEVGDMETMHNALDSRHEAYIFYLEHGIHGKQMERAVQ